MLTFASEKYTQPVKHHGVDKMFWLEPGPLSATTTNIVYLCRPLIKYVRIIAGALHTSYSNPPLIVTQTKSSATPKKARSTSTLSSSSPAPPHSSPASSKKRASSEM